MKTRKRKSVAAETNSSAPLNAPQTDAETNNISLPSETERNAEKPNRVSFYVTEGGSPDWERMQPKTKEQLSEILLNPTVQKELGFTREQAEDISKVGFGEDEANALLDLLGGIDSLAASKIYGIPHVVTSEAFSFSADQRKKINPPLSRILNKWGPSILKTWKDEIGLAMVLTATLNAQVRIMHMLEEKRKKNSPARPPQAGVTPITQPAQSKPEEKTVAKTDDPLENVGFNVS